MSAEGDRGGDDAAEIWWQLRPDLHWPFRFRDDKIVEVLKTFGTPALPSRSTVS